jgi:hypothetical protein
MSLVNSLFGTTGVIGGQTLTTNNAAQGMVGTSALGAQGMQNAHNQALTANAIYPGPLVSKQGHIGKSVVTKVRATEINFTVVQAHNGYVVTNRNYENDTADRYIAATVEEVKDLVASILVQKKLSE